MWWCLIITTIPATMLVIYRLPFIHKQQRFTWYTDFLQNGITWFPGYTICPHQHQIQMRYNWVKIKFTFIQDIPFHLEFNYMHFDRNWIKNMLICFTKHNVIREEYYYSGVLKYLDINSKYKNLWHFPQVVLPTQYYWYIRVQCKNDTSPLIERENVAKICTKIHIYLYNVQNPIKFSWIFLV